MFVRRTAEGLRRAIEREGQAPPLRGCGGENVIFPHLSQALSVSFADSSPKGRALKVVRLSHHTGRGGHISACRNYSRRRMFADVVRTVVGRGFYSRRRMSANVVRTDDRWSPLQVNIALRIAECPRIPFKWTVEDACPYGSAGEMPRCPRRRMFANTVQTGDHADLGRISPPTGLWKNTTLPRGFHHMVVGAIHE